MAISAQNKGGLYEVGCFVTFASLPSSLFVLFSSLPFIFFLHRKSLNVV